jgi:chromosome segregation ATPase
MDETWDAEPEQLKEPEMTTDDLVMMVGEATIKLHHSERMVNFLKQKVSVLLGAVSKEKTLALPLKDQIDTLLKEKEATANLIQSIEGQTESLKARIIQLENQVTEVAAQRDEARKEILELKSKPPVKRKK